MAVNNIEEAEFVLPYLARGEFCRLCARQEMYFTSLGHFGSTIKRFLDDDDIVGVEVEPIPKGVLSEDGTWHSICNMSYDSQFVKLSDDEGYLRILRKVEKPAPQWTSVNEEEAPENQGLLTTVVFDDGSKAVIRDVYRHGDWMNSFLPGAGKVTHWMPYPEPAKDGDE